MACVMARGGHYEHLTSSNVVLLHCIVGPYVFILYMMFHLNAGDDNDDVKLTRRITDVGYDMCRHAAFHKAL